MQSEKDQVLSFLFASCDAKGKTIADLASRVFQLEKALIDTKKTIADLNATITQQGAALIAGQGPAVAPVSDSTPAS